MSGGLGELSFGFSATGGGDENSRDLRDSDSETDEQEEDVGEDLAVVELLEPLFAQQATWIAFLQGGGSKIDGAIQVDDKQVQEVLNETIAEIVMEVSEQTELCDLLRALCCSLFRRGKEERKMNPQDVAIACLILDRLFFSQSEGEASPCEPMTLADEPTPSTEVASEAGNWGKTPTQVPEETGPVSWNQSAAAKEDKAGKEALDAFAYDSKKGIQHFLRSLSLSDELMLQFVDPDIALTEKQQGDYAKLLAMIWHDGLASEDAAHQQAAKEEVTATTEELRAVHKVTHAPWEWLQQLESLMNLNKTKLGCAAGLCWLKHCALGRMSGPERVLRMSKPSVPFMLYEAWKAHESLPPGVLDVVHHMLEQLESKEDGGDERPSGSAAGRATLQGDPWDPKACRDTFFRYVLDLVMATAWGWPTEELRRFLLALMQDGPATKEANFAVMRLLVSDAGLAACKACADPLRPGVVQLMKKLALTACQDNQALQEVKAAMEKLRPVLAKEASPEAGKRKRARLRLSHPAQEAKAMEKRPVLAKASPEAEKSSKKRACLRLSDQQPKSKAQKKSSGR